jgi:hypothetical protein
MIVFWDVTLCSFVKGYERFKGACCLSHQGDERFFVLMTEAEITCETSAAQHPKESYLQYYVKSGHDSFLCNVFLVYLTTCF